MKIFLRILDIAAYCLLWLFGLMFALIGLSALFLLVVEGDWMNLIGVVAGFALAWIILVAGCIEVFSGDEPQDPKETKEPKVEMDNSEYDWGHNVKHRTDEDYD